MTAVRHGERPGRIGAHELEQDGISRRLLPPVPFALPQQRTDLLPQRLSGEPEVDETWPRNLRLPNERRVQLRNQVPRDLPRVAPEHPGACQRDVRREVPVLGLVGTL